MNSERRLARSPELMSASDTGLLVVDVQGKLAELVEGHRRIIWNIGRLVDAAKLLGLPVVATEQYPKGLGVTTESLRPRLEKIYEKTAFSCAGCGALCDELRRLGRPKWLVCGIEAHVCVQQTVLDMMAGGYRIYAAADAVGSCAAMDYEIALERMRTSGATLTTVEAALFEWCEDSRSPQFKQISRLVRETAPA